MNDDWGHLLKMYVHIGGSYTISDKYIIGIFDFDATTHEDSDTINFLKDAEQNGKVDIISNDLPRSFIVTMDRVYFSPINASTIRKRIEMGGKLMDDEKESIYE